MVLTSIATSSRVIIAQLWQLSTGRGHQIAHPDPAGPHEFIGPREAQPGCRRREAEGAATSAMAVHVGGSRGHWQGAARALAEAIRLRPSLEAEARQRLFFPQVWAAGVSLNILPVAAR